MTKRLSAELDRLDRLDRLGIATLGSGQKWDLWILNWSTERTAQIQRRAI
jgi:hypothetical protein